MSKRGWNKPNRAESERQDREDRRRLSGLTRYKLERELLKPSDGNDMDLMREALVRLLRDHKR
jgi:hypothetical protein